MFNYIRLCYSQVKQLPKGSYSLYSVARNYFKWKRSLQPGRATISDGVPWMTFDAIDFLNSHIDKSMRVFEYGSGGSTVFFSGLASEVISVEHDKEWFYSVNKILIERGVKNWKGILCEPELIEDSKERDASDPDQYGTSDKLNRKYSFEKYVKSIDDYPDNYFDLIVIDGRSRPSCVKHGIPKLKKNGYLLLDNADRENYKKAIEKYLSDGMTILLNLYGLTSHNPEISLTRIWKKT